MKRFSARSLKGELYSKRAYDIPHSLLCRRSRCGPKDVLALLSVGEPEKWLFSGVFPAEKGSGANLVGLIEALVESVAATGYFGPNINPWNRTIYSRFSGFGHPYHRCDPKVGVFAPGLERLVRLSE